MSPKGLILPTFLQPAETKSYRYINRKPPYISIVFHNISVARTKSYLEHYDMLDFERLCPKSYIFSPLLPLSHQLHPSHADSNVY